MNRAEVSPEATKALLNLSDPVGGSVGEIKFTPFNDYTTFAAEVANQDGDLIFHFFLTEEDKKVKEAAIRTYWTEVFPQALEEVAFATFKALPPRLQGAFVSDYGLNSWWFRAYGFGNSLDPAGLCSLFFSELDKALDKKKAT